jgi:uncharacterized protein
MNDYLKLLNELKILLIQRIGNDIRDIILFGSHIYGTNDNDSDYDILIVLNRRYTWPEKRIIRDICYEISLQHDIIIDSKIISYEELQNSPLKHHPLYNNAIKQGIYA